MGKNKRRQLEAYDAKHDCKLLVDSVEEVDFIEWLNEACNIGIIIDFEYQPSSIELFQNVDYMNVDGKKRCLFRQHVYSPDFKISFNPSQQIDLAKEFKLSYEQVYLQLFEVLVDVKGGFAKNDGGRSFSLNQKWVWQKTRKYVVKVVPKEFFKKFGVPESCLTTKKTKKPRKIYYGYETVNSLYGKKTPEAKADQKLSE